MLLVKKCQYFHYLFSLEIRLEIRFNNVLDTKQPFFHFKNKTFECPKNGIFPKGSSLKNRIFAKGLTHAFGQKIPNFYLFGFGQNKTRKKCLITL